MLNRAEARQPFDPVIFWVSSSVTALFIIWAIVFPENMSSTINGVFGWTTKSWGWLYLITAFLLVLGCFVLMGKKYGNIKLGLPEDTPEFSNFSWFAMLFGSAIAAGIVFWGPAEPAYHYMSPPSYFGGDAKTPITAAFKRAEIPVWHGAW